MLAQALPVGMPPARSDHAAKRASDHALTHAAPAALPAALPPPPPQVRDPRAGYIQSLEVLREAKRAGDVYTKSSIMLGLGELQLQSAGWALSSGALAGGAAPKGGWVPAPARLPAHPALLACLLTNSNSTCKPNSNAHPAGESDDEVIDCMLDLRDAGVDILTLGQYLQARRGTAQLLPAGSHPPARDAPRRCTTEEPGTTRGAALADRLTFSSLPCRSSTAACGAAHGAAPAGGRVCDAREV